MGISNSWLVHLLENPPTKMDDNWDIYPYDLGNFQIMKTVDLQSPSVRACQRARLRSSPKSSLGHVHRKDVCIFQLGLY